MQLYRIVIEYIYSIHDGVHHHCVRRTGVNGSVSDIILTDRYNNYTSLFHRKCYLVKEAHSTLEPSIPVP